MSRSQGHVTYQQTKRYNLAVYGHINFKLGGNYRRGVEQTGSRNMADIQNIKRNNQRKTSPNRRNFAPLWEIGVGELIGGVYIYTGSS